MVREKDRHKYTAVSLPVRLFTEIERVIEQNPYYTGVAEFVRDAVREKIQQMTPKEEKKT